MDRSTFQKQSLDAMIPLNLPFLQTDANLRNFSLANLGIYYIWESLTKLFHSMRKGETSLNNLLLDCESREAHPSMYKPSRCGGGIGISRSFQQW